MRDFVIRLTHHRPGELAGITRALSLQGVNIRSIAADDVKKARKALA